MFMQIKLLKNFNKGLYHMPYVAKKRKIHKRIYLTIYDGNDISFC